MKKTITLALCLIMSAVLALPSTAQEQQKEPDINEIIDNTIEQFTDKFNLDYVQVFLLDSAMRENYPKMMDEIKMARKSGAEINESYSVISDKWMSRTDKAIEQIFTPEQWKRYLKLYGKEMNKREKRMAERAGGKKKQ